MIDDNGAKGQAAADRANVGRKAAWVTPTLVRATISGETHKGSSDGETTYSKNGS